MYFMLVFTLVLALSEAQKPVIALPAKLITLIVEKSPACIERTGARPEAVQQFFGNALVNDELSKQYNFCLFKSMGLSDDNGHFYVDRVLALYENRYNVIYQVAKTTVECNQIVSSSPVETMYQALKCFNDRAPAYSPY